MACCQILEDESVVKCMDVGPLSATTCTFHLPFCPPLSHLVLDLFFQRICGGLENAFLSSICQHSSHLLWDVVFTELPTKKAVTAPMYSSMAYAVQRADGRSLLVHSCGVAAALFLCMHMSDNFNHPQKVMIEKRLLTTKPHSVSQWENQDLSLCTNGRVIIFTANMVCLQDSAMPPHPQQHNCA